MACEGVSRVGVMVTTHLFGFKKELKMSTACFLQRLSSLLCTLTHTTTTFNHLVIKSVSDLAVYLSINLLFDMMITHACLKACPCAFCQANFEFVSVKFVSSSCSLLDQLVCSSEWTTFHLSF